ncbi:MAG: hypothetical protein ACEQSR_02720 [Candidatus Methylacidiphilales bacterium]
MSSREKSRLKGLPDVSGLNDLDYKSVLAEILKTDEIIFLFYDNKIEIIRRNLLVYLNTILLALSILFFLIFGVILVLDYNISLFVILLFVFVSLYLFWYLVTEIKWILLFKSLVIDFTKNDVKKNGNIVIPYSEIYFQIKQTVDLTETSGLPYTKWKIVLVITNKDKSEELLVQRAITSIKKN